MGRIQVLDETLSNQIAAGEVVERPASVAKELLENALDAGATAITVELVGGGIERLRIADDGRGMAPDDASLCLERHATSKVRTSEDLSHIQTLGFRGEALPSIASVSRFRLRTREAGALGATLVTVIGGKRSPPTEGPGPVGTEILVEDLFFNVPARRKFLKRPDTEAAHVQEVVAQLALAWPGVAFRLVKDGRVALDVPRHERLADRVRALFGRETGDQLAVVDVRGAYALEGLIGLPSLSFGSPRHYHCFVNGRYIRDRVVLNAVQGGYAGALERGRHPFVVLHLRIPPEAVDVNVHPAKTEVRFVDTGAIHRFVVRHLTEALRGETALRAAPAATDGNAPAMSSPSARSYVLEAPAAELDTAAATTAPAPSGRPDDAPAAPGTGGVDDHRRRIFDAMERLGARRAALAPPAFSPSRAPQPLASAPAPAPLQPDTAADSVPHLLPEPAPATQSWRPIAQVTPRLALCLSPDGLVLLDVPAARRQLVLDRLAARAPAVRLNPPRTIDLGADEARRLQQLAPALADLGFDVETFSGGTHVLKAVPAGAEEGGAPEGLLRGLLRETSATLATALAARVVDALRADEPATAGELLALLRALGPRSAVAAPYAVRVNYAELERRLGRPAGEVL